MRCIALRWCVRFMRDDGQRNATGGAYSHLVACCPLPVAGLGAQGRGCKPKCRHGAAHQQRPVSALRSRARSRALPLRPRPPPPLECVRSAHQPQRRYRRAPSGVMPTRLLRPCVPNALDSWTGRRWRAGCGSTQHFLTAKSSPVRAPHDPVLSACLQAGASEPAPQPRTATPSALPSVAPTTAAPKPKPKNCVPLIHYYNADLQVTMPPPPTHTPNRHCLRPPAARDECDAQQTLAELDSAGPVPRGC